MKRIGSLLIALLLIAGGTSQAQEDFSGESDFFITTWVSNPQPFVGEKILYHTRYYAYLPDRLETPNPVDFPVFRNVWRGETISEPARNVQIGGVQYTQYEFITELTPLQPGTLIIPEAILSLEEDVFFEREQFASNRVFIDVQALPQPPPDRFTDSVGQYRLNNAFVSATQVQLGEPITLTIDITGSGTFEILNPPRLQVGDAWRVVGRPAQDLRRADNQFGLQFTQQLIVEWVLVPQQTGELTVPPQTWVYFDPQAEAYVQEQTSAFNISVFPGVDGVEQLDIDSALIQPPQIVLKPADASFQSRPRVSLVFWLLWSIPPLGAIMVIGYRVYRSRQEQHRVHRRRQTALKRALSRLDATDDHSQILSILRAYIADLTNQPNHALPFVNLASSAPVDEALRTRFDRQIQMILAHEYNPSDADLTSADKKRLKQILREINHKQKAVT
jgi:hypothetical protein